MSMTKRFRWSAIAVAAMIGGVLAGGVNDAAAAGSTPPGGFVDTLSVSADGSTWTLVGWSIDSKTPTAAVGIHVYLDGVFVSASTANGVRDDVAAAFPGAGANHGFVHAIAAPTAAGQHIACVYAINSDPAGVNPVLGCRKVEVPGPNTSPPGGFLDELGVSAVPPTWTLIGWSIDPKTPTTAVGVHVYLDGVFVSASTANGVRDDVAAAFPGAGANHGFTITIAAPTAAGQHIACVYAINSDPAGVNPVLGCRKVEVPGPNTSPPGGFVDELGISAVPPTWTLIGWSIDSKAPTTPVAIHIYLDGVFVSASTANGVRDDVAAAFPGAGANHGFTITIAAPTAAGQHIACVYAINSDPAGVNPVLGCRKVTI